MFSSASNENTSVEGDVDRVLELQKDVFTTCNNTATVDASFSLAAESSTITVDLRRPGLFTLDLSASGSYRIEECEIYLVDLPFQEGYKGSYLLFGTPLQAAFIPSVILKQW